MMVQFLFYLINCRLCYSKFLFLFLVAMTALSDDYDHDVISNPGQGSLESSFDEFMHGSFSAVRELPASQDSRQEK
ncbi:hypothetical protein BYT27DRAFT_6450834 [Phlegmacium glaucopus]|nr:hypothetical protein BYT27DRAFT_6450834 [Phlegmacium glaucopus]